MSPEDVARVTPHGWLHVVGGPPGSVVAHGLATEPWAGGLLVALPAGPLFVGRSPPREGELAVLQASVSTLCRRHFRLDPEEAGWVLRDLKSTGGTFVGDGRVLAGRPYVLRDGDVIFLGAPMGSPRATFSRARRAPSIGSA